MQSTSIKLIQGTLSQKQANVAILRDGSVVSGRVLAKNSSDSYIVSLAGKMIEVKSDALLKIDEVFQAKVKITQNQVSLSLLKDVKSSSTELIQKFTSQNQNLSPELKNFLSSLGFEQNLDSLKILQFMQQIGVKFDVESAKKALSKSKTDGKIDQQKAQISFLLEEKGIASDDETVSALLGKNPRDSENSHQQENGKRKRENEKLGVRGEEGGLLRFARNDDADTPDDGVDIRNDTKIVKNFFSQVDSASLSHKNGVLSAFNTILSSAQKNPPLKHWIILPFEWDFQKSYGNFKLLFDSELKNLEKAIIDLRNAKNQSIFLLYFKNNEVNSVKFSSDSVHSEGEKARLCAELESLFAKKLTVHFENFDSLRGFCSDDENFAFVEGVI